MIYLDGRPQATLRIEAVDQGMILPYGHGPAQCDYLGMREAVINQHDGVYYLFYDGAGPKGWLACLAVSTDLQHWELRGPVLDLGLPGEIDAASASSPWVIYAEGQWHMFYVAAYQATPPPECIPAVPYATRKAIAPSLAGPWVKQPEVIPFDLQPGSYYSMTASPGHIIKTGDEYLMIFSAAGAGEQGCLQRTLGLARTRDLNGAWRIDPEPILPPGEQIENSSLFFEESNNTWYLFTNHVGMPADGPHRGCEYTDAIWVYWTQDPTRWRAEDKAVVLDGGNCRWCTAAIGLATVTRVGERLALFYDAPGGDSIDHMRRNIGLAWLELPLGG